MEAIVSVNAGVETIEFGGDGHNHNEQPEAVASERRLLISSMDEGLVEVVEPLSGEVIESLALTGPARLYPTENQRFAVTVQTDNDQVSVIDGGLWTEDHGDHLHDYEETPSLLDAAMTGERPIHFVAHGGTVAIFFDGEGTTQLIQQRELEDADAELATLDSGAPHHGVAVPLGDQVLLSMPDTESDSALPIGMAVYSLSGELLQEFPDCPGLHGEAALGDLVAFGCGDGVLIIDTSGESFSAQKIANPADGGDNRVGTIMAHEALPVFIGNFGSDALSVIDPAAGTLTPLPLPVASAGFRLDPHQAEHLVVLTIDGQLHTLDPQSGDILGSLPLIAPVDPEAERGSPRPALAVDKGVVYVSDHTTGEVFVVNLESMSVINSVQATSIPLSLATVGINPAVAEAFHSGAEQAEEETQGETSHDEEQEGEHGEEGHDHEHEEGEHGEEGHDHHDHDHNGPDPHTWFSIDAVGQWVANIEQVLSELDPANAEAYAANAEAYRAELAALESEIDTLVAELPVEQRKIVTDHDSFGYLAAAYDLEVVGSVVPSFSTLASPSAQQMVELQGQIEEEGVQAILVGTTVNPNLSQRLAEDTGAQTVTVYTGSLSDEDGPAGSYLDFMRYNVTAIVEALGR